MVFSKVIQNLRNRTIRWKILMSQLRIDLQTEYEWGFQQIKRYVRNQINKLGNTDIMIHR